MFNQIDSDQVKHKKGIRALKELQKKMKQIVIQDNLKQLAQNQDEQAFLQEVNSLLDQVNKDNEAERELQTWVERVLKEMELVDNNVFKNRQLKL